MEKKKSVRDLNNLIYAPIKKIEMSRKLLSQLLSQQLTRLLKREVKDIGLDAQSFTVFMIIVE